MTGEFSSKSLFLRAYPECMAAAYEAHPDMFFADAERLMEVLSSRLSEYEGPLTDAAFTTWAVPWVRHEATRYRLTESILTEHHGLLRAAIRRSLSSPAKDCAVDEADVFSDIARLVFQEAHSLTAPNQSAKITTRLWGLVKQHCWAYYVQPAKRRQALWQRRIDARDPVGVELISAAERAAERAAELNSRAA